MIRRRLAYRPWPIALIGGLLLAACGDADSPGGAGGTETPSGTFTPIGNPATITAAAAMTETSVGPVPTLAPIPPTVTPGGFPWREAGIVIDGTVTITGAVEAQRDFHVIRFGMGSPQSCTESVQGVSKEAAQSSTEAIFFEMDAYLLLPNPSHDQSTDLNAPDIVDVTFRVMPYAGPGTYDDVTVFQRGTEKEIPPGTPVPTIGFAPLPLVNIGGFFPTDASYSGIGPDTTITATVAADGSGELTFTNLYPDAGRAGGPISGTMTWTCTDHLPEEPPST